MQFSTIKGHRVVLSQLKELINNNTLDGAYIFQGPRGIGKGTIASKLSKYIVCTGAQDDSCKCENCRLFPNIPDYMYLGEEDDDSIKTKELEKIDEFLSLKPYRSTKRVLLIDNADNLTYSSANGLLKIVEDYKKSNIIIMVSSEPEKIPATLVSRTVPIEFMSLSPEDYIDILKQQGFNSNNFDSLKRIIPYLNNSILKNYSIYTEYLNIVYKFLLDFSNTDEDDLIFKIKDIDEKQELFFFVEIMIVYLNDILKSYLDAQDSFCNKDYEKIYKLKDTWTENSCFAFIERLRTILKEYNRGLNINIKPRVLSSILYMRSAIITELKKVGKL